MTQENAIKMKVEFFAKTGESGGVKTYGSTSILPEGLKITDFDCAPASVEKRPINSITDATMVEHVEAGKITPPDVTLTVMVGGTEALLEPQLSECDYEGKLVISKAYSGSTYTTIFEAPVLLLEDFSLKGTAKNGFTGTIKFACQDLPTKD